MVKSMMGFITTVALKIELAEDEVKWTVDTYPRLVTGKDSLSEDDFIDNFKKDYRGNGIEEVVVLETLALDVFDMTDIANGRLFAEIKKHGIDFNRTVLPY